MNLKVWVFLVLSVGILLTACNANPSIDTSTETLGMESVAPKVVKEASVPVSEPASDSAAYETAVDDQGEVTVSVTPLNLDAEDGTLIFDVAMDTHSVDLTMDLYELAILTTDNGRSVTPVGWDAAPGGHHVSGQLFFLAVLEGTSVLENATSLTLTIREVDVPTRTFTWALAD
ncbi:MAG: hypothetical protein R6X34_29035 [Chloroflexota bacterium]